MSHFTSALKTEWLPDGKNWKVLETFEFHSGEAESGLFVRCKEGMVTDLASIPLIIRWLVPKVGKDAQGAVVHDQVYRDGFMLIRIGAVEKHVPVSRSMADGIYWQAMKALKVQRWRREAIYRGLQIGGWVVWNKYREENPGTQTTM